MRARIAIGFSAVVVTAALVSGCVSDTTPPPAPPPESPSASAGAPSVSASADRIAFARADDPFTEEFMLWTGNVDGTDLRPVGDQAGAFPDWSPDRTHLIFDFLDADGRIQVGRIHPDGSEFSQLTHFTDTVYNEAPDYSPDGATIVFDRAEVEEHEPGFTTTLWVMDADGSNPRALIDPAEAGLDYEAEYSPDGSQIVFVRVDSETGATAIAVVGSDGSGVRVLTPFTSLVEHPRWSPDGATIIYNVETRPAFDPATNGIWTIAAAGGEPARLLATDGSLHPFKPDYSPDGSRILFAGSAGGVEDLYVMNADGSEVTRLTATQTYENYPVWD